MAITGMINGCDFRHGVDLFQSAVKDTTDVETPYGRKKIVRILGKNETDCFGFFQ
jgi:hypothetical protein